MSHTVIGHQGGSQLFFYVLPPNSRSGLTVIALEELDTRLPMWRFFFPKRPQEVLQPKIQFQPKSISPSQTTTQKPPQSHLGGEVSVEDAFAVQVLQPSGNIKRQTHPDAPRQVEVAVQQLLQIPSVDVLQRNKLFSRWCQELQNELMSLCVDETNGWRAGGEGRAVIGPDLCQSVELTFMHAHSQKPVEKPGGGKPVFINVSSVHHVHPRRLSSRSVRLLSQLSPRKRSHCLHFVLRTSAPWKFLRGNLLIKLLLNLKATFFF